LPAELFLQVAVGGLGFYQTAAQIGLGKLQLLPLLLQAFQLLLLAQVTVFGQLFALLGVDKLLL
jgi:hypothetical protein